ncbi:zinc finger, C2H2 type [Ancylostoma caninum]|uniref:Zinc finger, C2H2 type n=1 Tax=Ancylostoma caninum TaxID=29170 RepID=A0A368FV33_ANCCA|nr:zinc finger, C2H2 type [Ancylostoma caninum]
MLYHSYLETKEAFSWSHNCFIGVRPYKCEQCDKSFTQRCSLESHLRKVHGVLHNYGYKERRNKVFVCEECGFTSEMFDVYVSHLKMLHPFSASLIRLSAPPKKLQVIKFQVDLTYE